MFFRRISSRPFMSKSFGNHPQDASRHFEAQNAIKIINNNITRPPYADNRAKIFHFANLWNNQFFFFIIGRKIHIFLRYGAQSYRGKLALTVRPIGLRLFFWFLNLRHPTPRHPPIPHPVIWCISELFPLTPYDFNALTGRGRDRTFLRSPGY